jgi:hypothetical protein
MDGWILDGGDRALARGSLFGIIVLAQCAIGLPDHAVCRTMFFRLQFQGFPTRQRSESIIKFLGVMYLGGGKS